METWANTEATDPALNRFESAIDGWRRPAAYGIVRRDADGVEPVRVNLNEDHLSAAILATVCGHVSGTRAYAFDEVMLDRAIASLASAGANGEFDHPNLRALRLVREHGLFSDEVDVVFIDDLEAESADDRVTTTIATALAGRAESPDGTTTLWRPTGSRELDLVERAEWRAWPTRLADQPIFYPVLNEDYAIRIAREWNVPAGGSGFVTKFHVDTSYARTLPTQRAGGADKLELWIPAERLAEFNEHLVGTIEVTHRFGALGQAVEIGLVAVHEFPFVVPVPVDRPRHQAADVG
ncbi:MAG: hypothetical protein ACRD0P_24945 [Stackebrandtia sp.]